MRYATALVGPDTADNVVSSVVVRTLARPGGLGGLREPKQYLMKAILNETRSRHRRAVRRPTIHADTTTSVTSADGDQVVDMIRSLPARQRAAAYLVFYEEYTPTEAARLMGCRPATVRRYLHLARTKLREALDG